MGRQREARCSISAKRLSRFVFLGAGLAYCFLFSHKLAKLGSDSAEEELLLRLEFAEANLRVKAFESPVEQDEKWKPVEGSAYYERYLAVKALFNSLPETDSSRFRPMILQNFFPRKRKIRNKSEIVLATHLSAKKFNSLFIQLKYWNGPASVAVYIKRVEQVDYVFTFMKQNPQFLQDASFHLVLEKPAKLPYPVNLLRQVAMETIESDYFLAMDVDHIPLPIDCHSKLAATFSRANYVDKKKTLFVLPAFSVFPEKNETHATEDMLPQSKSEVVRLVKEDRMQPFRKKRYRAGHRPSLTGVWLNDTNAPDYTYNISITERESMEYEPYILGYKPGIPRYWEGKIIVEGVKDFALAALSLSKHSGSLLLVEFRGFHLNKISFLHECFLAGYRYEVLTDFYCVHLDHPLGPAKIREDHRKASNKVWRIFTQDYIWKKYGKTMQSD